MKRWGIVVAGAAAWVSLTACVPGLPGAGAAGGGDGFCAAFAENLAVNVENIEIQVSGDDAAKEAGERKVQASEDAVIALAPASIRSDVEILMADARAGRSEEGAPAGVSTSGPSERVAQYVTTHCLVEGLELLKKLGEGVDA